MSAKYFGGFSDRDSVAREFEIGSGSRWDRDNPFAPAEDFPTDEEILFAAYGLEEAYSGSALVIYERDGELYEVHGSHCSCYGLEGQWEPEETTWEALRMGDRLRSGYATDAADAYTVLLVTRSPTHEGPA